MAVQRFWTGITTLYGGYSLWAVLILGWGTALAAVGSGVIFSLTRWRIPVDLMPVASRQNKKEAVDKDRKTLASTVTI
jgi:hypothetical protein